MQSKIIHIFLLKQTSTLTDDEVSFLLNQLPIKFQTEIKAYKHQQSAQLALLSKIVSQYAFQELKIGSTLDDIKTGIKDRPYVDKPIDFNISHSGNYVAVAISANNKIGIDIEKHRAINVDLFKRYFDENEWQEIKQAKDSKSKFFDLWTIKESAIKCDGRGVEILGKTHKKNELENIVNCDNQHFYYQSIETEKDYSCTICSENLIELNTISLSLATFLSNKS
ncbi:MAG: 4'-phosphopantetheinyl transferase superfamily protein [Chitinophagales bacterium]|nr:4'-phosphopantetheinyl transferase superfamily protein [Bacteroidota bacterium]